MTDERRYRVVTNTEDQYSMWPADLELPLGWRAEGFEGTRQECASRVDEVWTDMRPAGLRRRMKEGAC
ncbi:MbtH family NRPS accessory protein [Streptomyces sp. AP-93]|uniref:MbtH family protein n=1 Tax=Streptomyces sp. AP-93 TaxID=2929048 RepID=UPI001FB01CBE|nr:MbtH family NRPS accessory protein [Streptomyces sp. AP-93]MCJ0873387.1 MbtH family NRPS accessory protein [Streptomyces sp. AP-93]